VLLALNLWVPALKSLGLVTKHVIS
jgi:hypothetical protein